MELSGVELALIGVIMVAIIVAIIMWFKIKEVQHQKSGEEVGLLCSVSAKPQPQPQLEQKVHGDFVDAFMGEVDLMCNGCLISTIKMKFDSCKFFNSSDYLAKDVVIFGESAGKTSDQRRKYVVSKQWDDNHGGPWISFKEIGGIW